MFCPYCAVNITTVPEPKFNCGMCWYYGFLTCIGTPLYIPFLWCILGDVCCYEAFHKCPICKRIIAQRLIDS